MKLLELPEELRLDWELLRREGGGGQSDVYRLKSIHDESLAVLKILRLRGSPEKRRIAVERFCREIDILKGCSHKNIVRILADGGEDDPWCVMPFGVPLNQWWPRRIADASISEIFDLASCIVEGLLDGLDVLHRLPAPVVHRDIKPENVILCDRDCPVLIDFGVAYRSIDDRLTELDKRPVANKYIAPGEAYYGAVDEPSPAWDCLNMSWLWAWMLAEVPAKDNRFHWRFHRFIDDPRCERVRAIFAACSEPSMSPGTAGNMLDMARNLGLIKSDMSAASEEQTFLAAVEAKRDADARLLQSNVEKQQMISTVAAVLSTPCREVYEELCKALESVPASLPIVGKPRNDTVTSIVAAMESNRGKRAWQIEIGRPVAPAFLDHDVFILRTAGDSMIPVGFRFRIRDAGHKPVLHYGYTKSLAMQRIEPVGGGEWKIGESTSIPEIIAEIQRWLADPNLWR
ncbi:MAG: protein kinase [Candidatus Hodarchaeota archaeon]